MRYTSLAATLIAWKFSSDQVEARTLAKFEVEQRVILDLIEARLANYEDTLVAGAAALEAYEDLDNLSALKWQRFSGQLRITERYPGVNGIGLVVEVTPHQLPAFVDRQHVYDPDFRIYPVHGEATYLPIIFLEPLKPPQRRHPRAVFAHFIDVQERRNLMESLEQRNAALEVSNNDVEQCAR